MLVVHFFENETNFLLTGVKHAFLQKQAAVVENNVVVCPFREVRQISPWDIFNPSSRLLWLLLPSFPDSVQL